MGVGGLRSAPKTEPCGLCTVPVEVTRRTARGRYSGSVLCDRCAGRGDMTAYFASFDMTPRSSRRVLARDRGDDWEPRAKVLFVAPDGLPVYGPEPSGIPVEDRSYATPWWSYRDPVELRSCVRTMPWRSLDPDDIDDDEMGQDDDPGLTAALHAALDFASGRLDQRSAGLVIDALDRVYD